MPSSGGSGAANAGRHAFANAHAHVLADSRIQFALPPAPRPRTPHWLEVLAYWIRHAWPLLRVLTWVVLAGLALFILYMIVSQFIDIRWPWRGSPAETATAEPEWQPDAAPARALLAEADALAAAGRYAEAARLILLRSVEDITRKRPGLVRADTTSRDLVATPEIPAAARPAFGAIAEVVEISLFADRGATADAWYRARDAYADFALAGNWR
ncbi:hypothetical protein [Sphingomonas abietis]|uniref:DUF4129 domain-containing protein n=1 Tax=Sphingomonas abietis TaxID=3012344 RepID=A0ABY7NUC8_9SPHN|nr:hypothetical protein [Sphingomonas abietis]WBO24046.1 hypothetical protein PBT88_08035 [Sphingomonas abietis]